LNIELVDVAESRSATIMAIGDGHMASATTHLQVMMSRFPEHIRKMPMKKFLKQHCPNTKASTRSDGTLCFDLVQDTPGFEPSQISMVHTVLPSYNSTDAGMLCPIKLLKFVFQKT
jgi:hypothetical protein